MYNKGAIYYAGFKGLFLKRHGVCFMCPWLRSLLCRLVTEESKGGPRWGQESQIPRGCCIISTIMSGPRSDHFEKHSDCLAVEFSQSNSAVRKVALHLRPRMKSGYCNRWTPFWGCRGWCCRSARSQWAPRKTAPLWRRHWSAWGQEDAAAAWITWQRRRDTLKLKCGPRLESSLI